MRTLPPLPEPDTHCFDDEGGPPVDVWSYSADQMREYATAAVLAERERCAAIADEFATYGGSNFYSWFKKLATAIRSQQKEMK